MENDNLIKYLWLAAVTFVGSVTGYLVKVKDCSHKTFGEKLKLTLFETKKNSSSSLRPLLEKTNLNL